MPALVGDMDNAMNLNEIFEMTHTDLVLGNLQDAMKGLNTLAMHGSPKMLKVEQYTLPQGQYGQLFRDRIEAINAKVD